MTVSKDIDNNMNIILNSSLIIVQDRIGFTKAIFIPKKSTDRTIIKRDGKQFIQYNISGEGFTTSIEEEIIGASSSCSIVTTIPQLII